MQAATGAEAREILETDQAFDLVLCDMMMPDMSGVDLHEWLADRHPRSGQAGRVHHRRRLHPTAREYLSKVEQHPMEKPFDVANFKKIVGDRIHMAKGTSPE